MRRVIALTKFDSFAKTSTCFLQRCRKRGYQTTLAVIKFKNFLSERQIKELCLDDSIEYIEINFFSEIDFSVYDIVYLGLTGAPIRQFFKFFCKIFKNKNKRPLLITGYPGIILKSRYIGYAQRSCCDIVLLNSNLDLKKYKFFLSWYGINTVRYFLYGYDFPEIIKKDNDKKIILFAEQAVIPNKFKDRMYVIGRLIDFAEKYPNKKIVIKPRIKPKEKTVFSCKHPVEKLFIAWKCIRKIPNNIEISYENIINLLSISELLVTISSTVALQGIQAGIPTVIIKDFGPQEELGIPFFMQSGCTLSFDELIEGKKSEVSEVWKYNNLICSEERQDVFFSFLEKKLSNIENISELENDFFKIINMKYFLFDPVIKTNYLINTFLWKIFSYFGVKK